MGCEKNVGYESGSFEALANERCGEYEVTGQLFFKILPIFP